MIVITTAALQAAARLWKFDELVELLLVINGAVSTTATTYFDYSSWQDLLNWANMASTM